MIAITPYPSNSQYRRGLSLQVLSERDMAILFTAETIATQQHFGQLRRDGTEVIRHPRAVALKSQELGLPVEDIAAAWLHDTPEDGYDHLPPTSLAYCFSNPQSGRIIACNIEALTQLNGEPVWHYYGRIIEASRERWTVSVIKLLDRWHFHVCPYGGLTQSEWNKAEETLGQFMAMCLVCREHIPDTFTPTYDELVAEVARLATNKLCELRQII